MATLVGANPAFAGNVQALIAASGGRVKLVSGVRSNAHQTALWNAALRKYGSAAAARKWVAPPGRSNHEKGTAVDLGGDLALAARLAPQFGLHRPLSNEPWHFEPIGNRKGATTKGVNTGAVAAVKATGKPGKAPAGFVADNEPQVVDPAAERKDIGVQIGALLNVLDKPIDFTGGANAA